jgi:hypothetical protein
VDDRERIVVFFNTLDWRSIEDGFMESSYKLLAAEFAAVRREEREACASRINALTEAVRKLAIDRDDDHGSTMSCLLCDHGWTIGEPEEHSETCAATIRAMNEEEER